MKTLSKVFLAGLITLTLIGCGGSSSGSGNGSGGAGGNGGVGSIGGGSNNSGSSSSIFPTNFYDCSKAAEDATEQGLFTAACGQHAVTFSDGGTGVVRISGALVNWDDLNKGLITGQYDNWRNFNVFFYMKSDQDLDIDFGFIDNSAAHPYLYEASYIKTDGSAGNSKPTDYEITKFSDTAYKLEITVQERDMFASPYEVTISIDITLDAQGKFSSLDGIIGTDNGSSASFTASGTPARNNPLLD